MGPAVIPDGKVLLRFKIGGPSDRDLARQAINEMMVEPTVTEAIKDYLREEAAAMPDPQPQIIEHPIDDALQTRDSRGLGGAMEIKSPWRRK